MTTTEPIRIGSEVTWKTWIGESTGIVVAGCLDGERRSGVLVQHNDKFSFIRTSEIIKIKGEES